MTNIYDIPIDRLHPHPNNPRKNLGDLQELVDSVKANGVLQNLTITPLENVDPVEALQYKGRQQYTVIIGHRRLAAAACAGLEAVPCVVVDMDEATQLRTMLMENIQRSDLTVYEQAQGFQMMMDMGESVEEIAKASGFSAATVRRRVKLLDLDPDKFKASEERGATLTDYMELDKIEDHDRKNEVLETIGTRNFRDALKKALDEEKHEKNMARWEAALKEFATEITARDVVNGEKVPMVWLNSVTRDKEAQKPEEEFDGRYFYIRRNYGFELLRERSQEDEEKRTAEAQERARKRAEEEATREALEAITERHFQLRKAYIAEFDRAKLCYSKIATYAAVALLGDGGYGQKVTSANSLGDVLGIKTGKDMDYGEFREQVRKAAVERPEYVLLAAAWAATDGEAVRGNEYWGCRWSSEIEQYIYFHKNCPELDRVYEFLASIGYEMSDEEIAMQNGTHEVFRDPAPAAAPAGEDEQEEDSEG